jgi:hypothetical protein
VYFKTFKKKKQYIFKIIRPSKEGVTKDKLLHEPKVWALSLKLELGMIKCFFPYTYASKTQKFNHKINVVWVNLKINMGINVNIHLHYG